MNPGAPTSTTSFAEDDINAMTSSEVAHEPSPFEQNATAALVDDGDAASRWRAGTLGLLAAATSVVTVGGNLIVILSFVLERTIRQPPNYFIASLAVSDLLIGQSRSLATRFLSVCSAVSAPFLYLSPTSSAEVAISCN